MESHRFYLRTDAERSVTASWFLPERPRAVITLAHSAGAGMDHPLLAELAYKLAGEQFATLRFNFFYTEQKRKRPDVAAQTYPVIEAAAREATHRFPDLPLFLGGKSFGGRMSSQWVAIGHPRHVSGLIFFGFPLHPRGKPATARALHLKQVKKPMLFIQGSKDELATPALLKEATAEIPDLQLMFLEGADHSLQIKNKTDYAAFLPGVVEFVERRTR